MVSLVGASAANTMLLVRSPLTKFAETTYGTSSLGRYRLVHAFGNRRDRRKGLKSEDDTVGMDTLKQNLHPHTPTHTHTKKKKKEKKHTHTQQSEETCCWPL